MLVKHEQPCRNACRRTGAPSLLAQPAPTWQPSESRRRGVDEIPRRALAVVPRPRLHTENPADFIDQPRDTCVAAAQSTLAL